MYVMRGEMPIYTMTYYMRQLWLRYGVRLVGKMMIKDEPFRELYFLEDAKRFRNELKGKLVYVGGVSSRDNAETALNAGFEFIQMGRALINEPDFVNRMKESEGDHRCGCDHINYCIARMYSKEMACHKHLNNLPKGICREIEKIASRSNS